MWVVGSGLVMAWIQPSLALDDVWASFTYTFEAGNRFGLLNHSRALWPQWSIGTLSVDRPMPMARPTRPICFT